MKILPRALLVLTLCLSSLALPSPALSQPARTQAAALLDQLDMQATLDQTIVVTLDAQIKAQPQLAPYRETMIEFFRKYMSYQSLKPDMIRIYEEAFTEQELSELRAFYATPVGRKSLQVVPSLMAKGAEMGQKRVEEHLPELSRMIQDQTERLKAK
ncbi:MAG: DUF2059 domain-containing protein [Arenimonas sp.]